MGAQLSKLSADADLLCLQEVDAEHSWLDKAMKANGLVGIFKQKTGGKKDGIAIYVRDNRFSISKTNYVEYNDAVAHLEEGDEIRERMWKNGVGIVLHLNDKLRENKDLVIATTHLFWDPAFADVKKAQIDLLMDAAEEASNSGKIATIICGDLNSMPNSDVYAALKAKYKSAYAVGGNGKEPQFTTCTPKFTSTIDYIFFRDGESTRLGVNSVLPMMSKEEAMKENGLPNGEQNSDHLPLKASFEVLDLH
eukprot:CAMPEP_0113869866 /NCGR_PEP_ID=MMETSP0780_2-20120614/1770_1 /TAXON_ID=652834 /ORGANISM="Palpitomonas bilix" /LENGTH=250 /DNA_ID=CAMNT_0000855083 /DNA_START=225 /DNA_END=977 /DNA_ORIENTATION=+ /assembly_acc=CAM_ASM_000599